jgi:hypothetical protein
VLGEFGDDPDRYQTAKGHKAFAGTAPVTRASGLRTVVVARAACNQRLVDACYQYLWAFAALTASPGARRCYDAVGPGAGGAGGHRCREVKRDGTAGLVGWMGQAPPTAAPSSRRGWLHALIALDRGHSRRAAGCARTSSERTRRLPSAGPPRC